jgi:hypothetical protein
MLAKSLSFMPDADAAGVMLGARGPIILTQAGPTQSWPGSAPLQLQHSSPELVLTATVKRSATTQTHKLTVNCAFNR